MTLPVTLPYPLGSPPSCWNPDHFRLVNGELRPQPWMQWRNVETVSAPTKTGSYAVTGGGNKNALIHHLTLSWNNHTPTAQWCYGTITRGGCRVTLQSRSRAYLQTSSAIAIGGDSGARTPCNLFGIGADTGVGGVLAVGSQFTVIENRANSITIPVAPERPGWLKIPPGQSVTATVEVRFISEFWESTSIDGGNTGSESSYESGATQLDLFAIPVI